LALIVTQDDRLMIRPMQAEDTATVLDMARELAAAVADPAPRLLASDLVRDGLGPERWFDCLVAELAGQLVGYAVLCKGFEAHTGMRRLWIGDFYVRPSARRRGTGRAVMAEVARQALQHGCDVVSWELWRMNSAGAAFYRTFEAEEAADLAVMRLDKDRLAAIAAGN
jgi:GNAT superfamily N-acetyltransferase